MPPDNDDGPDPADTGEDNTDDNDNDDTSNTDESPDNDAAGRAAAKARRQAASKTRREIAEKLGVTVDEAAAIIAAHKAKEDAEKSEAEKAKEQAEAAKNESAAATLKAQRAELAANLKIALLDPGDDPDTEPPCPRDRLSTVVGMALGPALEALNDGDDDPVATAIASLRESDPWIFVDTSDGSNGSTSKPAPPGPGRKIGENQPAKPKGAQERALAKIKALKEKDDPANRTGLRRRTG